MTRIGNPLTYDEAYQWLTSGESPAGTCSPLKARRLLDSAAAERAVHFRHGRDVRAPGELLVFNSGTGRYEVHPVPERLTVPGNVACTLQAAGLPVGSRSLPGWSVFWGGEGAVRVEWHGAHRRELRRARTALERSQWTVDVVTEPGAEWLRVTQEKS